MIELLSAQQNNIILVYLAGFCISLFVRFVIITSCIFISNNTRLKEIKNLTNRIAKTSMKKSYISLFWPIEIINCAICNIKYFLKK